jgi:hypothetical protein
MCLQWCHQRHLLIDNDFACGHCTLNRVAALPAEWACASCQYRRDRDGLPPLCRLTRQGLPVANRCCHWNVQLDVSPAAVTLAALAPGLLADQEGLTALADQLPAHSRWEGDALVRVPLDGLALPDVYGVPAWAWDDALLGETWEERQAVDAALTTAVLAASDQVIAAHYAPESAIPALEAAIEAVASRLGERPLQSLPQQMQLLFEDIVVLTRPLAGTPEIQAILRGWEIQLCLSQ